MFAILNIFIEAFLRFYKQREFSQQFGPSDSPAVFGPVGAGVRRARTRLVPAPSTAASIRSRCYRIRCAQAPPLDRRARRIRQNASTQEELCVNASGEPNLEKEI